MGQKGFQRGYTFGLWDAEIIAKLHEMEKTGRIIAKSRELNRVCEIEPVADDNVYRETLSELVKVAKTVWGKPFGEIFSSRYKRMERVQSNSILRVGRQPEFCGMGFWEW